MIMKPFSVALFFVGLVPTAVLGVMDYSCCKNACDNEDSTQECRDTDANVLNGGVCGVGGPPYWMQNFPVACKKVVCCDLDNCLGKCVEHRHVDGTCALSDRYFFPDGGFVCDATGKSATKCCTDDTCSNCDFNAFIFSSPGNDCPTIFGWQDTPCEPIDSCCLGKDQWPNAPLATCVDRCQKFQYTLAGCQSRINPPGIVCTDSMMEGDPHIMLWGHKWVDFHGACDLVLVDHPTFMNGLGFTVHVRTTRRYQYSYISSAAIKIGQDILEVFSFGGYIFNGVAGVDMPISMADFPVMLTTNLDKDLYTFEIDLGGAEKVVVRTYKDIVSVKIVNGKSFPGSVGLMGEFGTGRMLARDGATILEDPIQFGEEWQVRDNETGLFQTLRSPQYPEKCELPSPDANEKRRLGEHGIDLADAQKACESWGPTNADRCVFDVMATGDMGMAELGP